MMYFNRRSLPWQGLKAATKKQKYEKISEKKMSTSPEALCKVCVHSPVFRDTENKTIHRIWEENGIQRISQFFMLIISKYGKCSKEAYKQSKYSQRCLSLICIFLVKYLFVYSSHLFFIFDCFWRHISRSDFFSRNGFDLGRVDCTYTFWPTAGPNCSGNRGHICDPFGHP